MLRKLFNRAVALVRGARPAGENAFGVPLVIEEDSNGELVSQPTSIITIPKDGDTCRIIAADDELVHALIHCSLLSPEFHIEEEDDEHLICTFPRAWLKIEWPLKE